MHADDSAAFAIGHIAFYYIYRCIHIYVWIQTHSSKKSSFNWFTMAFSMVRFGRPVGNAMAFECKFAYLVHSTWTRIIYQQSISYKTLNVAHTNRRYCLVGGPSPLVMHRKIVNYMSVLCEWHCDEANGVQYNDAVVRPK